MFFSETHQKLIFVKYFIWNPMELYQEVFTEMNQLKYNVDFFAKNIIKTVFSEKFSKQIMK